VAALKPPSDKDRDARGGGDESGRAPASGAGRNDRRNDRPTDNRIPRIDSTVLLGPAGRVVIEHHGQRYELRETRFGKLILTK